MARMHTGKHGKSKSRKPIVEIGTIPESVKLTKEEIEDKIISYNKQGASLSMIGQYLKDRDGVPYIRQALGKRLAEFLNEKGASKEIPQDLLDLMKRAVKMRKHLAVNKQDAHNKTRLIRVESKIWRLGKYYKREGKLPKDWKYDPAKAALIIKG